MPRTAQEQFMSPFDPRVKEIPPAVEHIPAIVVKGIIRGLLRYFGGPARRSNKVKHVSLESLERALMDELEWITRSLDGESLSARYANRLLRADDPDNPEDWFVMLVSEHVLSIIDSMKGHTYIQLHIDSDLILFYLRENYAPIKESNNRFAWLKDELQSILNSLKRRTPCSECRGDNEMPKDEVLRSWSYSANPGELRNHILGHFHSLSPQTAKRILSTPPRLA